MIYIKYERYHIDTKSTTLGGTVFQSETDAVNEVQRWNSISKSWQYKIIEMRRATYAEQDFFTYPNIESFE